MKFLLLFGFIFSVASSVAFMISPVFTNFWFEGYGWNAWLRPLLYLLIAMTSVSQCALYICVLDMLKQNENKVAKYKMKGNLSGKLQENDDEQTHTRT